MSRETKPKGPNQTGHSYSSSSQSGIGNVQTLSTGSNSAYPSSRTETSWQAQQDSQSSYYRSPAPSINAPKGGASLRSIDEKFQVNPATGTASLSIPIGTTPGRNSMTPALSLSYDSGGGNSSFGLGWSLSLPSVTRKTSKGVPRYEVGEVEQDGEDVFLFSGVEDLVPKLVHATDNSSGSIFIEKLSTDGEFLIRQYIPRTEGSFVRIERWSHKTDLTSIHWRTISQSNVTSIYGISTNSRISDPYDARRIFSWLIAMTYDGKGNAISYTYKPDDGVSIDFNLPSERHRSAKARATNRYVKSIVYGNKLPNIDQAGTVILPDIDPQNGTLVLQKDNWMFEVVFDYGDHAVDSPTSNPDGRWKARGDAFSSCNSGFEIRTTRLCSRVLMFHHIKDELGIDDCLVSSTDLSYDESPIASYLTKVTQSGYSLDLSQKSSPSAPTKYFSKTYPAMEFEYSKMVLGNGRGKVQIKDVDKDSLENLPVGLSGPYNWIDLDGEGRPSVLYAAQDGWYRKQNLSTFSSLYNPPSAATGTSSTPLLSSSSTSTSSSSTDLRLGTTELIAPIPNSSMQMTFNFLDLNGNGSTDLMLTSDSGSNDNGMGPGFWQRADEGSWTEFTTFPQFPCGVDFKDPNLRYLDLTGDGRADIVISEGGDSFLWYPALGTAGYGEAIRTYAASSTDKTVDAGNHASENSEGIADAGRDKAGAPRIVFSNDQEAIYLADFTGDGLGDLVRIRNGDITYWPNIGYGRFGSKITLGNSPWMDTLDGFSYSRLRLGDIDGSGCADLLYFPPSGGLKIWMNEAGNSFTSNPIELSFPQIDNLSTLKVLDLFGSGCSSLVWSTSAPGLPEGVRMQYAEFNGGLKPHLLKRYKKGPAETRLEYKPSSQFYQDDKLQGIAWATKLPFPVQCLSSVGTFDYISGNYNTCQYTYHHGFYDGVEREFRGFGVVETVEREYFLSTTTSPSSFTFPDSNEILKNVFSILPVKSMKWYYTGAFFEVEKVKDAFGRQYYSDYTLKTFGVPFSLRNPIMEGDMTPEESRQAWRSLKGSLLREEIYQLDESANQSIPLTIKDNSYGTSLIQSSSTTNPINRPGVFLVTPRDSLTIQLERGAADHRVHHAILLETDLFGNATKSVDINYGWSKAAMTAAHTADDIAAQTTNSVLYTERHFTNAIDTADAHLVPLLADVKRSQIHGMAPSTSAALFTTSDFGVETAPGNFKLKTLSPKDYTDDASTLGLRLIERKQTRYRSDDLSQILPPGTIERMAIPAQSYSLSISPNIFNSCYQGDKAASLLPDTTVLTEQGPEGAGYIDLEANNSFWIPSGTQRFISNPAATPAEELAAARASFFTPVSFTDPFGQSQTVIFDNKFLLPTGVIDALGNTKAAKYDYSNLQPALIIDENGNREAFTYDELGSIVHHAAMGNPSMKSTGGSLDDAQPFRSRNEIKALLANPVPAMSAFVGKATSCVFSDFPTQNLDDSWIPGFQISIQRVTHISDLKPGQDSQLQLSISYFDGRGRAIQTKQFAEADADGKEWRVAEFNVFNKNGDAVRKFLPVYEDSHAFSRPAPTLLSTMTFYDALKRVVATLKPDMMWSKTVYGPWARIVWDEGDTIELDPLKDGDVGIHFALLRNTVSLTPSWLTKMSSSKDVFDQAAATQSLVYSKTPTEIWLDVVGNDYRIILDNGNNEKFSTRHFFDIQKHLRKVEDSKDRIASVFDYDMVGTMVHSAGMESGQKWRLSDVTRQQLYAWDSRKTRQRYFYDALRRPAKTFIKIDTEREHLSQQIIYGETQPQPEGNNLRGKVFQVFDQAAKITSLEYDYVGNQIHSQRQFVREYKKIVDWQSSEPVGMEEQAFELKSTFDALQRPVTETRSDGSVSTNLFNRQGLLKAVRGIFNTLPETAFISDIQYNANNQRLSAVYGNRSACQMTYDPHTLRMTSKKTMRIDHTVVQNLQYTRDCIGNTTHINDASQQGLFFRGAIVKPMQDFTYDAVNRLKCATGREHLGQIAQNQKSIPSSSLSGSAKNNSPTDATAMGNYTETYTYDSENNILSIVHSLSDKTIPGWTRTFSYTEPSTLETAKTSNRLSSTITGDIISKYTYDGIAGLNGLMSSMSGFPLLQWDVYNQLSATSTQSITSDSDQVPETTYYRYGSSGQRVRKVTERFADAGSAPTKMKDHFYVDGFCEVLTKFAGDGATATTHILTTHFFAGDERVVSLEIDGNPAASKSGITHSDGTSTAAP